MSSTPGWPFSALRPDGADWHAELQQRLFVQRIVLVSGRLDDELTGEVVAELMSLDALGDDPIILALSSPGGPIGCSMAIVDVIDALGVPVHATALGSVEGPPVGVLAVAARRAASPHARLRLCEDDVAFEGPARAIEAWVAEHDERLGSFARSLARRSSRPVDEILRDVAARRYLSAEQALEYGLIDEIVRPDAAVVRLAGAAGRATLGFRPSKR